MQNQEKSGIILAMAMSTANFWDTEKGVKSYEIQNFAYGQQQDDH